MKKITNKKVSLYVMAAIAVMFVGFASYSFASANSTSIGGQKNPPSIVGVVTEINGSNLTITARDNNAYTVDASHANVVKGFIGHWAKPSSFSDIEVTDTLTIIGDVNGASINAVDIAHNRTPQNISSNDAKTVTANTAASAVAPQISSTSTDAAATTEATSTGIIGAVKNTVASVVDKVVNFITGTTTSTTTEDQIDATTTPDAVSTSTQSTATDENVNTDSIAIETIADTGSKGTNTDASNAK